MITHTVSVINLLDLEEEDLNFDSQINGRPRWTLEEGQIRRLSSDEVMLPFLEFIDENVVGGKARFGGPYGQRRGMILSVKESAVVLLVDKREVQNCQ